jgi:hypothetical protein
MSGSPSSRAEAARSALGAMNDVYDLLVSIGARVLAEQAAEAERERAEPEPTAPPSGRAAEGRR